MDKSMQKSVETPIEIVRAFKSLKLSQKKQLYVRVREQLNYSYNPNNYPDNSNIRKMLTGRRRIRPEVAKIVMDYLGISRNVGHVQMEITDIVKLMPKPSYQNYARTPKN